MRVRLNPILVQEVCEEIKSHPLVLPSLKQEIYGTVASLK
jgi:hypothetical protein